MTDEIQPRRSLDKIVVDDAHQQGNRVFVKGWPPISLEVIDASDKSILVLRSEHGALVKVGRLAVIPANERTPKVLPG